MHLLELPNALVCLVLARADFIVFRQEMHFLGVFCLTSSPFPS